MKKKLFFEEGWKSQDEANERYSAHLDNAGCGPAAKRKCHILPLLFLFLFFFFCFLVFGLGKGLRVGG